jgi:hypothetical protein
MTTLATLTVLCCLAYIPLRRSAYKSYKKQLEEEGTIAATGKGRRCAQCIAYLTFFCYAAGALLISAMPKDSILAGISAISMTVAALTVGWAALSYQAEETDLKYQKEKKPGDAGDSPCNHKR